MTKKRKLKILSQNKEKNPKYCILKSVIKGISNLQGIINRVCVRVNEQRW